MSENSEDVLHSPSGADNNDKISACFSDELRQKFELYSYRNAATILSGGFPIQHQQLIEALEAFAISKTMIREAGGSKSAIAKHVDSLFDAKSWQEARLSADLHVRLSDPQKKNRIIDEYIKTNFLDGHRIDFVNGRVAIDLEWNSKDQTYDRDLYAFAAFYNAGAIDLGVIITRGYSLDNEFFRSLGKVLTKSGSEGKDDVYRKFGASTTWMGKLIYRLEAGRNGGCPVLAIGITPACVSDK